MQVISLLSKGNKNRMQEPTAANKESSRSHAVLQVWYCFEPFVWVESHPNHMPPLALALDAMCSLLLLLLLLLLFLLLIPCVRAGCACPPDFCGAAGAQRYQREDRQAVPH